MTHTTKHATEPIKVYNPKNDFELYLFVIETCTPTIKNPTPQQTQHFTEEILFLLQHGANEKLILNSLLRLKLRQPKNELIKEAAEKLRKMKDTHSGIITDGFVNKMDEIAAREVTERARILQKAARFLFLNASLPDHYPRLMRDHKIFKPKIKASGIGLSILHAFKGKANPNELYGYNPEEFSI